MTNNVNLFGFIQFMLEAVAHSLNYKLDKHFQEIAYANKCGFKLFINFD